MILCNRQGNNKLHKAQFYMTDKVIIHYIKHSSMYVTDKVMIYCIKHGSM